MNRKTIVPECLFRWYTRKKSKEMITNKVRKVVILGGIHGGSD